MVLAYKAVDGTAPAYLQALLKPHTPARSLRSTTSAGRLVPPSLRASKARSTKSQLFSVLGPQWWNELPAALRTAESLTIFRKGLKTHLFRVHLDTAEPPSPFWPPLYTVLYCIVLYCIVLYCIIVLNCVATAVAAIIAVTQGIG